MTFHGHIESIMGVVFSPNGKSSASKSYDGTLHIWDKKTGQSLRVLQSLPALCGSKRPNWVNIQGARSDGIKEKRGN